MQRLNKKFRLARIALSLTQEEFADLIEIDAYIICAIEDGSSIPTEVLNMTYVKMLVIKKILLKGQIELNETRIRILFSFVDDLGKILESSVMETIK